MRGKTIPRWKRWKVSGTVSLYIFCKTIKLVFKKFQIIKLFGIPIQLHWSFALMFMAVFYIGIANGYGSTGIFWLLMIMLSLFFCVVLHELGHALTARRFGIRTKDITLSPIGGVAMLDRMPEKPFQEIIVALAGPAVNMVIAGLLLLYFHFFPVGNILYLIYPENFYPSREVLLPFLLVMNVTLAVFNLLPAFPMDGGRVFRGLLSLKWSRLRATRIASVAGKIFASAFTIFGIYNGDYVLAFIGVFIFSMANQEYKYVKFESSLREHLVAEIYRDLFKVFQITDSLQTVLAELKKGLENSFLVYDNQNLIGVIYEKNVLSGLKENEEALVGEYTVYGYEQISTEDTIKTAYAKMQSAGVNILAVFENGKLVGVLDSSMINNFVRLQEKLKT